MNKLNKVFNSFNFHEFIVLVNSKIISQWKNPRPILVFYRITSNTHSYSTVCTEYIEKLQAYTIPLVYLSAKILV